jgi:ABC-type transport system substrate-binding protein
VFGGKEYPWLAESGEYNADFTELTIKLRPEAMWSDGVPVTSKDVVFTFEGQLKNDKLPYHAAFDQFVKDVQAPDAQTVIVSFKAPAPRFKFEVLSLKFDTGIPIVPEHVLGKEADVNAYVGGADMPHSGPYSIVSWNRQQKVYDLREDWWAVKAGVNPMPDAKRQVYFNIGGQVGGNMESVAQRCVNNDYDDALGFPVALIRSTIEQNPKITTHSGDQPPHGYLDWWPNSLWVNTQLDPFSDVRVRRAISYAINRPQLDEIVYEGAEIGTPYPFPLYPGLIKFVETPEIKALEEKYEPAAFSIEKSDALMTEAGFAKNGDGLWEKDGKTVPCIIHGFEGIHGDVVPVMVEQLKQAGFDASINFGPDAYQSMADGKPGLYMFGHGASLVDPYAAFELYHSRFATPIGTTAGNNRFSRYVNPEYDKVVDEMAPLPAEDPKFFEAAVKAMEIYWRDVIDIPVVQFLHRIPYNQTYWTNWPTEANPANGFNGAFWHHTGLVVTTNLKKAGA